MSSLRHEAVLKKSEYVLEEYKNIVTELIGCVHDIPNFMKIFSERFPNYQDSNKKKMDPASIREGNMSCSAAAALLAVWWLNQYPHLTPVFLIEDSSTSGYRTTSHVITVLPTQQPISEILAVQAAFYPTQTSTSEALAIDWTFYSKMKYKNPEGNYPVNAIMGLDLYIRNRIALFGLPKEISSRKLP